MDVSGGLPHAPPCRYSSNLVTSCKLEEQVSPSIEQDFRDPQLEDTETSLKDPSPESPRQAQVLATVISGMRLTAWPRTIVPMEKVT